MRRFFWRFFRPAVPSADELAAMLHRQYRTFRWVNVYRPFDPIGTSLFSQPGRDFSTGQRGRLLIWAHTDYWSDSICARCVRSALEVEPPIASHSRDAADLRGILLEGTGKEAPPVWLRRVFIRVICILPVALVCASRLYLGTYLDRVDYVQRTQIIEESPGESEVRLITFESPSRTNTGFPTTVPNYMIRYSTTERSIDARIDRHLWNDLKAASHGPVKVRYRRDRPSDYYIPNYDAPQWHSIGGWIGWAAVWTILSAIWCAIASGLGPLFLDFFLGISSPQRRAETVENATA